MIRFAGAALAAIVLAVTPVVAQQMTSDGYAFIEAVKKQDGGKATALLEQPSTVIINARDRATGDGGLHIVARERNRSWLGFLISKGARVDLQNNEGMTPLAVAAQIGWVEGVETLLARKASVDLANRRGETPLMFAVFRRDLQTARVLIAAGADPRKTDNASGYSALDYAKRDARASALITLLEEFPRKKAATFGPSL